MLLQKVLQMFSRTTQSMAADLYDDLIERHPAVKRSPRSNHAVAPDHRSLHHPTRGERDDK